MKRLEIGQRAPDFTLPGVDGRDHALSSFQGCQALAVVFSCNHCPYVQAYEDRLLALQRAYAAQGVRLVAINANDGSAYPEDNFDNMVRRAKQRGFTFPYLRDETQRVARAFGAEYTPEVFLLDGQYQVRYIGRIDDNWQHPAQAQSHDLRDAIEAVLHQQPVSNPVTHAIGCTIKWKL